MCSTERYLAAGVKLAEGDRKMTLRVEGLEAENGSQAAETDSGRGN